MQNIHKWHCGAKRQANITNKLLISVNISLHYTTTMHVAVGERRAETMRRTRLTNSLTKEFFINLQQKCAEPLSIQPNNSSW